MKSAFNHAPSIILQLGSNWVFGDSSQNQLVTLCLQWNHITPQAVAWKPVRGLVEHLTWDAPQLCGSSVDARLEKSGSRNIKLNVCCTHIIMGYMVDLLHCEGSLKMCFQEVKLLTLWFRDGTKWTIMKCKVNTWGMKAIGFILSDIKHRDFLNKTLTERQRAPLTVPLFVFAVWKLGEAAFPYVLCSASEVARPHFPCVLLSHTLKKKKGFMSAVNDGVV